jgi:hypothetical protein
VIQVARKVLKELKTMEESNTKISKQHETEFDSKARRAQGGKGLLSHTNSLQKLQESISQISPYRRKRGGQGEGGREGAWLPVSFC